jgi:hypothetical protein
MIAFWAYRRKLSNGKRDREYTVRWKRDGKYWRTDKTQFADAAAARAWARQKLTEYERQAHNERMGVPDLAARRIADIYPGYIVEGHQKGGKQGDPWSAKHASNTEESLSWWWKVTGWATLAEINLAEAQTQLAIKRNARNGRALVGKTRNEIIGRLIAFCRYCVRLGYAPKDWEPLSGYRPYNKAPQRIAREYSLAEFRALLRESEPAERLAYLVAACTVSRFAALKSLQVRHLLPTRTILFDRMSTKGRREQRKHLPGWLFEMVVEHAAGRGPDEPLLLGLQGHFAGKTGGRRNTEQ